MIEFKKTTFYDEEVNKQLANIIKNKSFANGYIFYGAEGIGKKKAAIEFVKGIFKQYSSSNDIEKKIASKNHPDFLIIEPSSIFQDKNLKDSDYENIKKGSTDIIKIAQIRHIKTFLGQKSIDSEKKIVLIINAHLLNESASNCLLKTLEEPSNGIFILLTSKLNLLLDTIISRCQIIRFKTSSSKQIEQNLKEYIDPSKIEIYRKLGFQDLINTANGSPGQLLKFIEIWNELSNEITSKLDTPIKDILEIFEFSKSVVEKLDNYQQIHLINLIQTIWWRKTRNKDLIGKLENLKFRIKDNNRPRIAWENTFLKIIMQDL